MAASDATPFPIKNQAYRVTFPILDADGDLVTGATGLDSEVSKDAGTFADCTNEATEIATSSGVYYLDLTATEMNADTVAIIVKSSTSGAKTTTIVLYPITNGLDIPVNATYLGGTAQTGRDVGASVLLSSGTGTGQLDFTSGVVKADVRQFGGTNATTSGGRPEVNTSHVGGTLQTAGDLATLITAVDDLVDTEVAAIFNRIGAPVGASISADIASVLAAILVVDDYVDTEIAAMPASVWSYTVEGSYTAVQLLRIALAAMAGKLSGAATTTVSIRDLGDTKNRIVATVDADGNRSAVTLDGT